MKKKLKVRGFKASIILGFILAFSACLKAPAFALDPVVKLENSISLTPDLPYYQSGAAVASCDFRNDASCTAFFDAAGRTLYLHNYSGPALDLREMSPLYVLVDFSGTNLIETSGEYGLRAAASDGTLAFSSDSLDSSLTIRVRSSFPTAVAIDSSLPVNVQENVHLILDVSSALPTDTLSGANVAGIVVPSDQRIFLSNLARLEISNPTGSYSMYGGKFQLNDPAESGNQLSPLIATHKLTSGVGDVLNGNDFETEAIIYPAQFFASRPGYTYSHLRSASLGTFRLLYVIEGVNAEFSPKLTAGESFNTVEARLRASLARNDNASSPNCLTFDGSALGCISPDFAVDPANSFLENLADPSDRSPISQSSTYAFRVAFKSVNENFGFAHYCVQSYCQASINGQLFSVRASRDDDGYHEAFSVPLTVTPAPQTPEPDPEPEIELPIIIPKAPNTGRA